MKPESIHLLLLAHAAATFFMTGLIWFVQVVHYPLFSRVGAAGFAAYEQMNTRRTGWVVGGPMLLELGLTCWIVWLRGDWLAWSGLGLLAVIWLSTAVWLIPLHFLLETGYDASVQRILLRSNWIRTVAWSLRGGIALGLLMGESA